jgi:hypothetical protein
MEARCKALSPETNDIKNSNRRQDSSQLLSTSWDDTEAKMTSHKRKSDAMINLAGRPSHRERTRPVVAAGTKGPKQRRQKNRRAAVQSVLKREASATRPSDGGDFQSYVSHEPREELYFPLRKKLFGHNRSPYPQLN